MVASMGDISIFLWVAAMIAAYMIIKRLGQVKLQQAKLWLNEKRAILVDVRSEEEFAQNGLPGALNLPLHSISAEAPLKLPCKDTIVLCHCLSGMRSASAASALKRMGYQAYNLGSYARARSLK
jgi:phage shock protein E